MGGNGDGVLQLTAEEWKSQSQCQEGFLEATRPERWKQSARAREKVAGEEHPRPKSFNRP